MVFIDLIISLALEGDKLPFQIMQLKINDKVKILLSLSTVAHETY
jgi:hypothetical protein